MKRVLSTTFGAYRQYKTARNNNPIYRVVRSLLVALAAGYLLLLCFPQVLFAHQITYHNLTVYSREPFDQNIYAVLDKAQARLATSEINNAEVKPKIFLIDSFKLYSILSLHIGANSFGKGYALLPTGNVFINKADFGRDLVFRNAATDNQRSLSGVIAHEITHLLVRKRFGYWRNSTSPTWKREGYAEYVAGGSTLDYETGVSRWKANPKVGTGYQYFKYYLLVKYLLEHDKLSVDELFTRDFDMPVLEQRVFQSL